MSTMLTSIKEKPILFSGAMVRSIIEGRKTQTRRVIKPPPSHDQYHKHAGKVIYEGEHRMWCWNDLVLENIWDFPNGADRFILAQNNPYGVPGDRLWVRETFCLESNAECYGDPDFAPPTDGRPIKHHDAANDFDATYDLIPRYRATEPDIYLCCEHEKCNRDCGPCQYPWKPSIHMPRWASRITLEITNVRVQRLQEISEGDAEAEGINTSVVDPSPRGVAPIYPKNYGTAIDCFHDLWNSINAHKYPWSSNPWVWAISFEKVAA